MALALPSRAVPVQTPLHRGEVGVRGTRLAQVGVQGVARGIQRVVVLLERLLGRLFPRRPARAARRAALLGYW